MRNVESIAEQRERLCQAFDALEKYLKDVSCSAHTDDMHAEKGMLEEKIRDLTETNENLLLQLKHVTDKCSELRMTCSASVGRLNSLISIVQSIIEQEENTESD